MVRNVPKKNSQSPRPAAERFRKERVFRLARGERVPEATPQEIDDRIDDLVRA